MENYLDGPETPDEVDDFRKSLENNSEIGCTGCVLILLLGIAVAVGFILLIVHILNYYRL